MVSDGEGQDEAKNKRENKIEMDDEPPNGGEWRRWRWFTFFTWNEQMARKKQANASAKQQRPKIEFIY